MEAEGSSKLDRVEADEGLRDGMEVEDDELEAALEHGGRTKQGGAMEVAGVEKSQAR